MCTPLYEFRHGTSSAPRHCFRSVSPLPLFRSALASPPRILFCVPPIQFSFFRYGGGGRGRVSPKEKLTEFLVPILRTRFCQNYFSGDLDLAKPRLHFPPAERGLGNECGRVSESPNYFFAIKSTKQKFQTFVQ